MYFHRTAIIGRYVRLLPMLLLALTVASVQAAELTLEQVQRVFPTALTLTLLPGDTPAYAVSDGREQLGYAFTTSDLAPTPAYSGKPIDTLVGLGEDGLIRGVTILHHEEPILVIGVSNADLSAFVAQFIGKKATDRIQVGAQGREGFAGIDGISGATITAMVLTSTVNKAVHEVAQAYGIAPQTAVAQLNSKPDGAARSSADESIWQILWQDRIFELSVVALALLLLMAILFFQDWLVKRKVLFHRLRVVYLLFTVFFIGFYCSAQLSVVNLLAFFQNLKGGFPGTRC